MTLSRRPQRLQVLPASFSASSPISRWLWREFEVASLPEQEKIELSNSYRPGMGLNAYFAYQVVGIRGTGSVPYSLALTAVFVEGFVFIILALTGMRHWLVKVIPGTIKTASGVGIGLFLTMVGMSYSEGIGIITGNPSTPLTIAGCDAAYLDSKTGACTGHLMTSSKVTMTKIRVAEPIADLLVDVAWYHVRRAFDFLPNGISRQGCYHSWCGARLNLVVAVSRLKFPFQIAMS